MTLKQHGVIRAKVCLGGCYFPSIASVIIVPSWPSAMQTMDLCVWLAAVITYGINMCLPQLSILSRTRQAQKVVHSLLSIYHSWS